MADNGAATVIRPSVARRCARSASSAGWVRDGTQVTQVGRPAMQIGIMMMTVILPGFALYAMRSILTPFALAIFLLLQRQIVQGVANTGIK